MYRLSCFHGPITWDFSNALHLNELWVPSVGSGKLYLPRMKELFYLGNIRPPSISERFDRIRQDMLTLACIVPPPKLGILDKSVFLVIGQGNDLIAAMAWE